MINTLNYNWHKLFFVCFFTLTLCSHIVSAQAPQAIPYQAVARDNTGAALVNQNVSFQISIHDLIATGTIVYQETHSTTTNGLGLVTLQIGQGTPITGTLSAVNWGTGSKFIQVELDPTGGIAYTDMGTTQLMSVPYALHAGSAIETDPKVGTLSTNKVPKWNGTTLEDGAITDNGTTVNVAIAPFNFFNVQSYGGGIQTGDVDQHVRLYGSSGGPTYNPLINLVSPGGVLSLLGPGFYAEDTSTIHSTGDLWIQNDVSALPTISATKSGNVGIGTASPNAKLDIVGNVKIMDGSEGVGKILTSDANGLASWQVPAPAVETDPQVSSTTNNAIPKWNGTALVDGIMTDNGNSINANVAAFNYLNVNSYGGGVRVNNGANEHATLLATNGGPYYQATLSLENAVGNVQLQSPLQGNTDTSMLTASGDLWFRNGPSQTVTMNIKQTGEVGVGTTTPSAKLEVRGSSSSAEMLRVTNDNNASPDSSFVILNNGNVGIGTLTPSSKLTSVKRNGLSAEFLSGVTNDWTAIGIGRTTGEIVYGICDAANNWLPGTVAGDAIIRINDATKKIHISPWGTTTTMTIADEKVGIGTTSPIEKLTVQTAPGNYGFTHTDGSITVGSYVGGGSGGGWFGTKSNHNLNLFTNNSSAQLTLTTAGNVGIGTTAPTAKLSVNGNANNTTGAWGVFSDARVKTVNSDFTDGLDIIKKIHPVKFTYKANAPFIAQGEQIGIVAQELELIAPYMVSQKEYGDMKDLREVNNQAYIFLLINAIKEQQTQIEELKALIKK